MIPETPVRVEYELTNKGRGLEEALCAIARWAEEWLPAEGNEPVAEVLTESAQSLEGGGASPR